MFAWTRPLRRARVMLGVYYALMTAYRGEILLWAIATSLPLIMMGVWVEAGASGAFALSRLDMARYFIAVFLVRQFTIVWVVYDFEYHVVSGRLSPLLLQPIHPTWRFVMSHLGEQLARLPFCVGFVALCFVLFPVALWGDDQQGLWLPGVRQWVLAVLAIGAAFTLRYLMQFAIATLSFWFERASAFERVNMLPYLFLSGIIAPLEVYGGSPISDWVGRVALWTPFPYLCWFPARILVDGQAPILRGFAIIAAWCAVFLLFNAWLWRRGLRHYSAMGA